MNFVLIGYQEREEAKHIPSWEKIITKHGGEIVHDLGKQVTHVLAYSQKSELARTALAQGKRLVTAYWLNDTIEMRKLLPPWKAIHFPIPTDARLPIDNMTLTITGFEGRDRDYVKDMISMIGGTYTGYFTKNSHAIICKEQKGEKYNKAIEWKVPVLSSVWLNEVMFGCGDGSKNLLDTKYQKFNSLQPLTIDSNLVLNLLEPWKREIKVSKVDELINRNT